MATTYKSAADNKTSITALLDDQLVDMAFITNFTGMTDKWFYRLISENAFPAPIKLGRSSRWRKSQVEAWLLERMKLSED
ncbi:AlpA family phage regulatory protein [Enterobacter cloacae]|uniref:helix-turn-helix transcriptional regulator n=1 Tax=Enterobacterales TaxID=91347 RepID=UPI0019292804|nr:MULTISPECIES: AlpA family phage regulatory protein [Citrobacter]EGT0640015.1 AlpA family phage regulatory protein [Citrobacter werkmanii]EHN8793109.1 AlpA family phage regulatory protein [Enterobacter kobei]EKW2092971.1 AlpA family phage regulatory protein [Klebsiella variicola]ELE9012880.1 AlpA family phage regulatory protein [Enterobacter cloacae]HAT1622650.1 AlpA family phage regulatory protein [Raoultella planticola]HBM3076201.1 AlpA family phage regulatory protein [Klebsiella oxytoca]